MYKTSHPIQKQIDFIPEILPNDYDEIAICPFCLGAVKAHYDDSYTLIPTTACQHFVDIIAGNHMKPTALFKGYYDETVQPEDHNVH